LTTITD